MKERLKTALAQAMCGDCTVGEGLRSNIVDSTMRIGLLGLTAASGTIIGAVANIGTANSLLVGSGMASTALVSLIWLRRNKNPSAVLHTNIAVWLLGTGYFLSTNISIASTLALGALLAAWKNNVHDEPSAQQDNEEIDQLIASIEVPKATLSGLRLSGKGKVVSSGELAGVEFGTHQMFADQLHLADRISLLQVLADLSAGETITRELALRINVANVGEPECFQEKQVKLCLDGETIVVNVDDAPPAKEETAAADSKFLAIVSHELRTPLNAIIGFSDVLRGATAQKLPQDKRDEYAELIHGAGNHLLSLVNTILDVSKIESGNYSIFCDLFDFNSTAIDSVAMLSTQAESKNIVINNRIDRALGEVFGDRRAVKQVLINLISNAIKYTPENGFVTLDAMADESGLTFEVSDTGIGMNADELAQIGQPFAQIDNSITRNCEGTGLGLSLVKGLIELHGGELKIESKPGVGTRVIVHLPNADEQGDESTETLTKLKDFMAVATPKIKEEISNDKRKAG